MKRLLYVDSYSVKSFHEVFNAASLLMCSHAFDKVIYFSGRTSRKAVECQFDKYPINIQWRYIPVLNLDGKVGNFLHYLLANITNVILLLLARKGDVVFYNYHALWFDNIINSLLKHKRSLTVLMMCHGEMEYLESNEKLNYLSNRTLDLLKNDKYLLSDNFYYCVLGESILKNVKAIIPYHNHKQFISFEHPFISTNIPNPLHLNKSIKKVGFVGTVRLEKGFYNICTLVQKLKEYNQFEFHLIGRIYAPIDEIHQYNIKFIPGAESDWVSKEDLNERLSQMDYVIFTYPSEKYRFTASGALFDAINHEKCILSLHNEYFDYIFNTVNIGYLFNDIEEIGDFLCANTDVPEMNFEDAKKYFSPLYQSGLFKQKLESILNRKL